MDVRATTVSATTRLDSPAVLILQIRNEATVPGDSASPIPWSFAGFEVTGYPQVPWYYAYVRPQCSHSSPATPRLLELAYSHFMIVAPQCLHTRREGGLLCAPTISGTFPVHGLGRAGQRGAESHPSIPPVSVASLLMSTISSPILSSCLTVHVHMTQGETVH